MSSLKKKHVLNIKHLRSFLFRRLIIFFLVQTLCHKNLKDLFSLRKQKKTCKTYLKFVLVTCLSPQVDTIISLVYTNHKKTKNKPKDDTGKTLWFCYLVLA